MREVDGSGRPAHETPVDDAALVARVLGGQTQAYGELVRRYQDRIFNTCWRICGHLEEARDLTQETFLKAFQGLPHFHGRSGFYTWVFRVAVNLSLTHRRKSRLRRTVPLEEAATGTQAESLAEQARSRGGDDPDGRASDVELQAAVAKALHVLEDEQRAVIVLRDVEGFDYQQISEILRIPAGTVKSRLFRARAALRAALEPLRTRESE